MSNPPGQPYRTIMSEAIDPVLGSRPIGLESTGGAGCGRPPADLIRVNVYAPGARSHTRVETAAGEHVSSTGADGETVEGPAGG